MSLRVCVIGASGGIGGALVAQLAIRSDVHEVFALSRQEKHFDDKKIKTGQIDILNEASIASAAKSIGSQGALDIVIVATGILSHGSNLQPEKSYRQQSYDAFDTVFSLNTFAPAMVAKYFLPLMPKKGRGVFAALSARVGSISDNRLGGWHAYRASKAALNMLIRNYAIEQARCNPNAIIVSLHPGTVDTGLSKPFQSNVPETKLFSPAQSALYLLNVIGGLNPDDSGKQFDWAGKEIPA